MKTSKGRQYLDDFKKAPGGEYVWTGQVFVISAPRRATVTLAALSFAAAAAVIGSGCVNAAGMNNSFYVIIPYILEISAVFALCWQTVKLCIAGGKIKAYIKDSAEKYLPAAAMGLIIASVLGFVASTVFIILNGTGGKPALCVVYIGLKSVETGLGIALFRFVKIIGWKQIN
ncbi:MAG: hypothetical protein K6G90_02200 [Clostridia bacterium]|nr:hypothetical protein [Clostridia bacterium]